jgi:hypothetical protein
MTERSLLIVMGMAVGMAGAATSTAKIFRRARLG